MPTPTIPAGNLFMNATLYTGSGGTTNITGFSFQPDLIWTKNRSNPVSHCWVDSNRGAPNQLGSDLTAAENSGGNDRTVYGGISTILSNGYTAVSGSDPTYKATNGSGQTYVSWYWKANQGTNVSNTSGSITSTVSANTTSGFSVVTFTAGSGNQTVGHGLGVAPSMVVLKRRNSTSAWLTYHSALSNPATSFLSLNTTDAVTSATPFWGASGMTSTTIGTSDNATINGATYVAYCWAPIAGYSAFGSYTGNGSSDGPFVYTGFRPRFVLLKDASLGGSWIIHDTSRNTYNVTDATLYPNYSNAESSPDAPFDILSNGFKLRGTGVNDSGQTHIYAAFAEVPFKFANAR